MKNSSIKKATFAAGCFWGVEDLFMKVNGISDTKVGYEGGTFNNPSYKDVCSNTTGHAEVVELCYDDNVICYDDLLKIFFEIHDPTTLNRQGVDIGTQYRSVIFYHSDDQREKAIKYIDHLNAIEKFDKLIVTEVIPASIFYRAEEYHQKYFLKNGGGSCHF